MRKFLLVFFTLIQVACAQQIDWNTQIRNKPTIVSPPFDYVTQITNKPTGDTSDFTWSQTPGGSITASITNTVTLTPCPKGVAGTSTNLPVYLSGGVGTAEAPYITGGTCTSEAATGTITFVPANNHSGAFTVGSGSSGIMEHYYYNVITNPSHPGTVTLAKGNLPIYNTLIFGNATGTTQSTVNSIHIKGQGSGSGDDTSIPNPGSTIITYNGPSGSPIVKVMGPIGNGSIKDMMLDGNALANIGLDIVHSYLWEYRNLTIVDWTSIGVRSMAVNAAFVAMATGNNGNEFANLRVWSQYGTSAAIALQLGQATQDGIFDFASNYISNSVFRHDLGTGAEIRFADANLFNMVGFYGAASIKFIQATGHTAFPGSNTFVNTHHTGAITCNPSTWTIPGAKNVFVGLGQEAAIDTTILNRCALGYSHNGENFGRQKNIPLLYSGILDADLSDTVANTTSETAFAKSKTVAAHFLNDVGATLRVRASGRFSTTGTPALTIKWKLGGVTYANFIFATGSSVTNDSWNIDASVVIMQTGPTACAGAPPQSNCGLALVGVGQGLVGGFSGTNGSRASATTGYQGIDTDSDLASTITAQWGAASASNTVTLDTFQLELTYPGSTELN